MMQETLEANGYISLNLAWRPHKIHFMYADLAHVELKPIVTLEWHQEAFKYCCNVEPIQSKLKENILTKFICSKELWIPYKSAVMLLLNFFCKRSMSYPCFVLIIVCIPRTWSQQEKSIILYSILWLGFSDYNIGCTRLERVPLGSISQSPESDFLFI